MTTQDILALKQQIKINSNNSDIRSFEISSNKILFIGGSSNVPIEVIDLKTQKIQGNKSNYD
jgi:hypothetical protein